MRSDCAADHIGAACSALSERDCPVEFWRLREFFRSCGLLGLASSRWARQIFASSSWQRSEVEGSGFCLRSSQPEQIVVKKINLILLSLIAALPSGYLVYELARALTLSHIFEKKLLGGAVVATGIISLLAIVWPLVYALAFYNAPASASDPKSNDTDDPTDTKKSAGRGDGEEEGFHEEDLDAFEGQEIPESSDDEEYEASDDDEFSVDDDQIEDIESADFDLGDESFEDIEDEEEEAPKAKAKKKKK